MLKVCLIGGLHDIRGADWRHDIVADYTNVVHTPENVYLQGLVPTIVNDVICLGNFKAFGRGDIGHAGGAISQADVVIANFEARCWQGFGTEIGYTVAKTATKVAYYKWYHSDFEVCDSFEFRAGGLLVEAPTIKQAFLQICALRGHTTCYAGAQPPGDSPIEQAFATAWKAATGNYPQAQVQIGNYRVDFLVDNLVIECDGHEYHASREQRGRDAQRDIKLQRMGYRVARFTGSQIHADAAACVSQALGLLA